MKNPLILLYVSHEKDKTINVYYSTHYYRFVAHHQTIVPKRIGYLLHHENEFYFFPDNIRAEITSDILNEQLTTIYGKPPKFLPEMYNNVIYKTVFEPLVLNLGSALIFISNIEKKLLSTKNIITRFNRLNKKIEYVLSLGFNIENHKNEVQLFTSQRLINFEYTLSFSSLYKIKNIKLSCNNYDRVALLILSIYNMIPIDKTSKSRKVIITSKDVTNMSIVVSIVNNKVEFDFRNDFSIATLALSSSKNTEIKFKEFIRSDKKLQFLLSSYEKTLIELENSIFHRQLKRL